MELYDILKKLDIKFEEIEHEPVFYSRTSKENRK